MQSSSCFYRPQTHSIKQPPALSCTKSQNNSLIKSRPFPWEHKVSPRMHKLTDPQRSNQPVQAYLRLDLRLPSAKKVLNSSLEKFDDSTTRSLSRMTSAAMTPVSTDLNKKGPKILEFGTSAGKIQAHSVQQSLKKLDVSGEISSSHRLFEQRGFLKDLSNDGEIFYKKISEARDDNTEASSPSGKNQKATSSKASQNSGIKNEMEQNILDVPQPAAFGQQLTFRTNTATVVETESKGKDEDEESSSTCCNCKKKVQNIQVKQGNTENHPNTIMNDYLEGTLGLDNKDTCSRKLEFEEKHDSKNLWNKSRDKGFRREENKSRLKDLDNELRAECEYKKDGDKRDKNWNYIQTINSPDMTKSSAANFYKVSKAENSNESNVRKKSFQGPLQQSGSGVIELKEILKHRRERSDCVEVNLEKVWSPGVKADDIQYNEEIQLRKMAMELQKSLAQKNMEILQLKNDNKMNGNEHKAMGSRIVQSNSVQKRLEDELEQLSQQISCQRREIVFLSKCKERLEKTLPDPKDMQIDASSCLSKIGEYEKSYQQKMQQIRDLAISIEQLEEGQQHRVICETRKGKDELRKIQLEEKIRNQEIVQLKDSIKALKERLLKYDNVEEKLILMDSTQTRLIQENETIRNELSEEETRLFQRITNKRILSSQALLISKELTQTDHYTNILIMVFESLLKRERLPAEIFKISSELNRRLKENICIDRTEKLQLKNIDLRVLSKKMLGSTETINKKLINCMDDTCEEYAKFCGNQCNLQ